MAGSTRASSTSSTLRWAIAFSVLVHAALLTVRFVDPEGFKRVFQDTPLSVVLVNARSEEAPETPQAVAQHTLAGGGDAEDHAVMASTPLPPQDAEITGESAADEQKRQIEQLQQRQRQLLTQVRAKLAALPPIDAQSASDDPAAREQEEHRRKLSELLAAIERRMQEESARPRKRYLSPATLGVTYAQYYDEMRLKIEEMGTANFPSFGGRKLYGELMMALLINQDGRILDARVVQSSGNRILDRLAEAIAQKAAPFGPFTDAMRRDTERFDVTALFRFTHDATLETTLQTDKLDTAVRQQISP